jgi:hypothetical protein
MLLPSALQPLLPATNAEAPPVAAAMGPALPPAVAPPQAAAAAAPLTPPAAESVAAVQQAEVQGCSDVMSPDGFSCSDQLVRTAAAVSRQAYI